MANDISGFGLKVIITASNTFPAGLVITQFADDGDPLDVPAIKIGDGAAGLNGDTIFWRKAVLSPMTLRVIPNSVDDVNLAILFNANRSLQGSQNAKDIITAVITYQDGSTVTKNTGTTTDFSPGSSVSSAGRLKTKDYSFLFGSDTGSV